MRPIGHAVARPFWWLGEALNGGCPCVISNCQRKAPPEEDGVFRAVCCGLWVVEAATELETPPAPSSPLAG